MFEHIMYKHRYIIYAYIYGTCNIAIPDLMDQLDSWDAEEHTINKIVEYICVFSIAFE
jgi:hypothetical protein